jgi:RNA polymerase sigma factor (TIGR02999 family)
LSGEITVLLQQWREGDPEALSTLTPIVYDQLRIIAGSYVRNPTSAGQVQATELVNELFVELLKSRKVDLQDRQHFFAFSAKVMRWILIGHVRSMKTAKRGAELHHIPLNAELAWVGPEGEPELLDLEGALEALESLDADKSRYLELRYFFGFTADEVAEMLGVSKSTVDRGIRFALVWLRRRLHEGQNS